jgi:hypothetical protein
MSTTARKTRKRLRRAALDAGDTALAESLRFQHPRRTGSRGPTWSLPVTFDNQPGLWSWVRDLLGRG